MRATAVFRKFLEAHPQFDPMEDSLEQIPLSNAVNEDAQSLTDCVGHLRRLHNLSPSLQKKLDLIDSGYTHSTGIFHEPEHVFVSKVSKAMSRKEAKAVYRKAGHNCLLLSHLACAMGASESPVAQSGALPEQEGRLFETIPSYQEIFGGLDYCDCPSCKSIFGPAAYFVDLMRIIEKHIELEDSTAATLRERRPDLFCSLRLNCENTNETRPYLALVNDILLTHVKTKLEYGGDTFRELSRMQYPGALPFHLPLERVKLWLGKHKLTLSEVMEAWGKSDKEAAYAFTGLPVPLPALLESPLEEAELCSLLGRDSLELDQLAVLDTFLGVLELTMEELYQILAPDGMDLQAKPWFINQPLGPNEHIYLAETGEQKVRTLQNITVQTLERICRLVRLQRCLGISFGELDWVLRTLAQPDGRVDLVALTRAVRLSRTLDWDLFHLTAMFAPLKDYGEGNVFEEAFGLTRAELEASANPRTVIFQRLDIPSGPVEEYLGEPCTNPDMAYRLRAASKLLRLPIQEALQILALYADGPMVLFDLKTLMDLDQRIKNLSISADMLAYLIWGEESPAVGAPPAQAYLEQWIQYFREQLPSSCRADEKLLAESFFSELAVLLKLEGDALEAVLRFGMQQEEIDKLPQRALHDQEVSGLAGTLRELYRWIALLKQGVSPGLLFQAAAHKEAFGISAPGVVTLDILYGLETCRRFAEGFGGPENLLLQSVEEFCLPERCYAALKGLTGWPEAQIAALANTLCTGMSFPAMLETLQRCFAILDRLHLGLEEVEKLLQMGWANYETYDALEEVSLELSPPAADESLCFALEARKRDALTGLAILTLKERYADITTQDKLYKYFLIDVNMDDKTQISPVKEGINALQLYLQRCRMRLERGVKRITIPTPWWAWIMSYSNWEANRRIFVYPENYLLPSLRHTKSTLFREVEEQLQQSRITSGYIEQQYVQYLDRYYQLTKLKVCGAYATEIDNTNVLFLFGRTQQQPYTYYYCKRVSSLAWSEWQKIDVGIDSTQITPVFVFNRLHLFWSAVKENAQIQLQTDGGLDAGRQNVYSLEIKFTYLDLQGNWIMPQTLLSDKVLYAETGETIGPAGLTGTFDMEDSAWKKLTLLRLREQNLEGFIEKQGGTERLAVLTGPMVQTLCKQMEETGEASSMDKDYKAYCERLNQLIQSSNFEAANQGDGYLCTGLFKLYNEDLEEETLIQPNEFYVVDGYIAPSVALLYTPLYDTVHQTIGVYLSQNILRDAAQPQTGILPQANNTGEPLPYLEPKDFIITGEDGVQILTEQDATILFNKLVEDEVIAPSDTDPAKGRADERWLVSTNLMEVMQSLFPGRWEAQHQVQEIQKILLKNVGAVYLFTNASRAEIIPVVNQPGSFIYDCGDETFLVFPAYQDKTGLVIGLDIRKTDDGVSIGWPITISTFERMGIDAITAGQIMENLHLNGLINEFNILNTDRCTWQKLVDAITSIFDNDDTTETENEINPMIEKIFTKLQNYPIVDQEVFKETGKMTPQDVCTQLENMKVLSAIETNEAGALYRVNLFSLRQDRHMVLTAVDAQVQKVYRRLSDAVSSIHFNYRVQPDFPEELRSKPFKNWRFGVTRLTNPTIKKLRSRLERGGIDAFLNLETQKAPNPPIMPFQRLGPTRNIFVPKASDGAQVDFEGLYAEYNWELFYHIPVFIAQSFSANGMYEEGMKWYHYIFDPTKEPDGSPRGTYCWNFLPFTEDLRQQMRAMLENPAAIAAYNDSPFDPHAIARLRPGAYARYTVIEYVRNILQWGDWYFSQNTWEALTSATMMYVWAYELLGPQPRKIKDDGGTVRELTFQEMLEEYAGKEFPQFIIDLEEQIQIALRGQDYCCDNNEIPYNDVRAYFGVPENEQMLALWDVVEDRLYKIRNSLDINGAPRVMPLYEAPAEILSLVRAAAAQSEGLPAPRSGQTSLYPYRFTYIIEQAKAVAAQLVQLGSAVLSASEKGDSEALLLLTTTQERALLQTGLAARKHQVEDADFAVRALEESKRSAQEKYAYYADNVKKGLSDKEFTSMILQDEAALLHTVAGGMRSAASIAYLAPQVGSPFAMKYGGQEIGSSLFAGAYYFETIGALASHVSSRLLTMAQYERRSQEWELMAEQALGEVRSLEQQIESLTHRLRSSEAELELQSKTILQKDETLDWLKSKFTSTQLYTWLLARLNTTAWQTYQLALELALAAQEAFANETDSSEDFLQFAGWDSAYKGLQAGEGLQLALARMQQAYLKNNERRLEIEKTFSLALDFPEALLALKTGGSCELRLPEEQFARDYPGCYRRKIKAVSLTVPAVVPPYQTVKAILRQSSSRTLLQPDEKGIDYLLGITSERPGADIVRDTTRPAEKIAVSRGIDDSGLFSLQFEDPRYLPFEGTGVDSVWQLEMPKESNPFELDSLPDLLLTVRYTALEDARRDKGSFYEHTLSRLRELPRDHVVYGQAAQAFGVQWRACLEQEGSKGSRNFSFDPEALLKSLAKRGGEAVRVLFRLTGRIPNEELTLEVRYNNKVQTLALQDGAGILALDGGCGHEPWSLEIPEAYFTQPCGEPGLELLFFCSANPSNR